jgi:hypothetical protein
MPRFKSILVSKEEKNPDGSVKTVGQTAWIPVDDAAKAHKITEKAIQLGAYHPKDPNEQKITAERLRGREIEDLRRKGMIAKAA